MSYWNFVTPNLALNASMLSGVMYSLQLYMNSSFSIVPAGGEAVRRGGDSAPRSGPARGGAALAPVERRRRAAAPDVQAAMNAAAPVRPAAPRNLAG